ncbi:MAG: outer membrane beta-barrel protein [Saprospiraceae bacterium]
MKNFNFRSLFMLVFAVGIFSTVQAQHITLGPVVGVNFHSVSNFDDTKASARPLFGAAFMYSITEHFGIGADLLYSMEGAKDADNNDIYFHTDYLRVPIKAAWFFGDLGSKLRPKLYVGVSPAFLIGGKDSAGVKATDYFEGFDFGLLAGGGLNYRIGESIWLQLDLNYTHGLTNILDINDQDYQNRNFGVQVGVGFPIGKN